MSPGWNRAQASRTTGASSANSAAFQSCRQEERLGLASTLPSTRPRTRLPKFPIESTHSKVALIRLLTKPLKTRADACRQVPR